MQRLYRQKVQELLSVVQIVYCITQNTLKGCQRFSFVLISFSWMNQTYPKEVASQTSGIVFHLGVISR